MGLLGKVKRGFNTIGKGIRAGGRAIGKVVTSNKFKTALKVGAGLAVTAAAIYGGVKAKGLYDEVQEQRRELAEGVSRLREMKRQFDEKPLAQHVVDGLISGGGALANEGKRQLKVYADKKAKSTIKKVKETKQRIEGAVKGGITTYKETKQKAGEMVSGGVGALTQAPSVTEMITDNLPADVANTAMSQNMFDFLQPSSAHEPAQLGDFSNEELATMTGLIRF